MVRAIRKNFEGLGCKLSFKSVQSVLRIDRSGQPAETNGKRPKTSDIYDNVRHF